MPAIIPAPLDQVALLRIGNADATFGIDRDTGFLRSAVWQRTGVELFAQIHQGAHPQTIGGLRIYDELDERWYSDLETPATVSGMRQDGTFVFVPLGGYKNCAVVKLFVSGHSGAPIGAGRFQESIDYCGDPESAFCGRNDR